MGSTEHFCIQSDENSSKTEMNSSAPVNLTNWIDSFQQISFRVNIKVYLISLNWIFERVLEAKINLFSQPNKYKGLDFHALRLYNKISH